NHFECGDGFTCEDGSCVVVVSEVGDACERELDCGIAQRCVIDPASADATGRLGASGQSESPGAGTAVACRSDNDCRTGVCAVGQCTQLCTKNEDCPRELACVELPSEAAEGRGYFYGCLQG